MQFSVLYWSAVPDVELGRRLHELSDLDDKAVSKILFHRRKEEVGAQTDIRLVQKRFFAATLVQASPSALSVRNLNAERQGEAQLLRNVFVAAAGSDRLVTWGGVAEGWPLLNYRALQHRISVAQYSQVRRDRPDVHLDLKALLCAGSPEAATSLNEISRVLGHPGMLGLESLDLWEAYLEGRHDTLLQRTELGALNLYLLALRVMSMTGELSQSDAARGELALRDELRGEQSWHRQDFRELWRT